MSNIKNNVGDKIVAFPLVDKDGTNVLFTSASEAIIQFTNKGGRFITKTKTDSQVVEGDEPNYFQVELQESETLLLGKEELTVYIEVTLTDATFSDGEATSNTVVKLKLWDV